MAIIKASALVAAISGNLGGVNFAQGKGSPYARQRIRRVKPTSAKTAQVSSRMQFLRHKWQQLTEDQRTAWRRAAGNRPRRNRFGLTNRLSGAQLFISHNIRGWYDDGPFATTFDVAPPGLAATKPLTLTTFTCNSAGSKGVLMDNPTGPAEFTFVAYGARTFSTAPRISWYNFKFIERIDVLPGPGVFIHEFTAAWNARIGDPQVGEQCWLAWFTAAPSMWPSPTFTASVFAA